MPDPAIEAVFGWREPCNQALAWTNSLFAQSPGGGALRTTQGRFDRDVARHPDRVAYHREGEPGDTRTLTRADRRIADRGIADQAKTMVAQEE